MIVLFNSYCTTVLFSLDHEHGLLDLDALDFVGENRKGIEAKLFEVLKALGMNHARIAVCREIKGLSVDEQVSSSLESMTTRPTGGLVAATSNP